MAYNMIVEDLCVGIIGMFHSKKEAPGKLRRYIIEYKPATMGGFASKPKRIPSTVPPEGIIEIPGTQCADGFPRLIIFSYGNDDLYPPLIPTLAQAKIGDTITKLDELAIKSESKMASLNAQQRMHDRDKGKAVKESVDLAKSVSGDKKRRKPGFISMDLED